MPNTDDLQRIEFPSPAYDEGWSAFNDGMDFTMGNPFPFLSNAFHDWQRGWTDAQEDAL